jgi:geranylgeranyl diphosphate synthase, type I
MAADQLGHRVQAALAEFLDQQASSLAALGPDLEPLLDTARIAVSGGKGLRPAFCYWGWRAAGAPDDDRVPSAGAALELLHASALVHDDVMDASQVRRGRPAAHLEFAALHTERGWAGAGDRFGAGAALLLGDLLLSWSAELMRRSGFDPPALTRALPYVEAMRTELIAGQFLDLVAQAGAEDSVTRAMGVLRYKAAKYTVERPLQVGAALAGAEQPLLGALSAYGVPLGEAFQLRDDLLGLFGDPGVTGKPAGDDLREGKRTVLTALAMQTAGAADRALLAASIGDAELDAAGVEAARDVIARSGALAHVEELIADLTGSALAALDAAALADEARCALRELAAAATQRSG